MYFSTLIRHYQRDKPLRPTMKIRNLFMFTGRLVLPKLVAIHILKCSAQIAVTQTFMAEFSTSKMVQKRQFSQLGMLEPMALATHVCQEPLLLKIKFQFGPKEHGQLLVHLVAKELE